MGQSIRIRSADGGTFDAYLAADTSPRGVAVLLLPEMFGVTPAMMEAAEDFAADGFTTLVPNLFWRDAAPGTLAYDGPEREAAHNRLEAMDRDLAVEDIGAALAAFRALPGVPQKVVAVGHCVGGRLAVLAMVRTDLDGAVSYYGLGISSQGAELATIRGPIQLHYGLADPYVPLPEIEAVKAHAAGNPNIEILEYPGAGHSFCNPYRPMFSPSDARRVRMRTIELLERVERNAACPASLTPES
ncbi:dienelactone hydrolase family protein [Enterovirga aerilata]|uniref:Dienelactone hydrolase family protein n=1 Tax=Enterovirga aerilata TaxID=2730920 RepID=A0A849HZQ6_9HYPH|nr:dienelactone hydrolase family protein [Enterovirga sp. DB1703]